MRYFIFLSSLLILLNCLSLQGQSNSTNIIETKLANGLTILVKVIKNIPNVAAEIWYKVGSIDESVEEKGIAHCLEHMIIKGALGENAISLTVNKLSGYLNAFTSKYFTKYVFNMPHENWDKVLTIMAECMKNCHFDPEQMKSELQETVRHYLSSKKLAVIKIGKINPA